MWDPNQYALFSRQRSRPFHDLLARLRDRPAAPVVDLGCGSGELTRLLAELWPAAVVTGVDSSAEMLARAGEHAILGRLSWLRADIATWSSEQPVDLLFSNAALHWVPRHEVQIPRLAAMVAPGGRFAVQMPNNFAQPSHQTILAVAARDRWKNKLAPALERPPGVMPLRWYAATMLAAGFGVDAWETEYLHVLHGDNPVREWVRGTALRPLLNLLTTAEQEAFLAEVGEELARAYPPSGDLGTIFPFQRVFFVATRR
ncbi:MAG: methyltransferase domain-containing protein [Candidatus Schekmanbacteria bacterium]|nr:methyltransferase domain-containing protein [Candidatus Schekmanbacteria bacterium]